MTAIIGIEIAKTAVVYINPFIGSEFIINDPNVGILLIHTRNKRRRVKCVQSMINEFLPKY